MIVFWFAVVTLYTWPIPPNDAVIVEQFAVVAQTESACQRNADRMLRLAGNHMTVTIEECQPVR